MEANISNHIKGTLRLLDCENYNSQTNTCENPKSIILDNSNKMIRMEK